ncbi:MAG TPA: AAA family ATPase [Polyangiales bacterium]|nr:AAA family ATPase [Polyangiales bacterium]
MPIAATDPLATSDITEPLRPTQALQQNTLLADRYRLQQRLGSGGSGVVYEALDEARANARVALKLLISKQPSALMRLKNEFRALARTVHPNLVGLHGLGVDRRGWFVVMDLIDPNCEFVEYVRAEHAASCRLRDALAQLLRGVSALHAAGKLHRDLKPSNVLVSEHGRVVIVDFGLLGEPDADEGQFVGTPAYAAPEQMRGQAVGPSADMYAVGTMLYEALTGRLPVDAPNNEQLLAHKLGLQVALPDHVEPYLAELCCALLAPDPARRPSAEQALLQLGESPSTRDAVDEPPFVARAHELTRLHAALARTQADGAQLALVMGPSGIGKTALSAHFAERARAQAGALVLSGRCHPLEQVPYKAFDTLLDALATHLARMPELEAATLMPRHVALLARLFPALATVPVLMRMSDESYERDPAILRARAFGALKELLARISDRRPLLLTLDDLHWSDVDSMELLRELLSGSDAPACLVLCTLRSDHPRPRLLDEIRSRTRSHELELGPLSSTSTLELARALLGDEPDARLVDESAGSPLLIEQLARAARVHGASRDLAETVRALLDAEPARALIELVCAAGHPIAIAVAARAVPLDPAALHRVSGCWLLTARMQHDEDLIEPRHDRLRETVLEALPPERLCALHAQLAYALVQARSVDPEQIAQHFRAAGLYDEAAPYLAQAAARAMDALAFARAEDLYQQALAHAPERRDELELALARAQSNLGKIIDAAERMERVLARTEDPERRHTLLGEAMMLNVLAGRVQQGARLLDQACRELGEPPVPSSGARTLVAIGSQSLRYLAGPRIAALPVPASAQHQGQSARAVELCLRATRGFAGVSPSYGEYFALRTMLAIRRTRDPAYWPLGIAWDLLRRSVFTGVARPDDELEMGRAITLAEQHGDPETLALVWGAEGARRYTIADFARAADAFRASERVLQDCGRAVTTVYNGSRSGMLAAWLTSGHMEQARAMAALWNTEALAVGDRFGALVPRVMGGYALLAGDDPRGMRQASAILSTPFGQQTLFPADPWWQGEPCVYEGDAEGAWEAYQRARAHPYFHAVERSPSHRTAVGLYAGRVHLMLSLRRDRTRHLRATRAIARSLAGERHRLGAPMAAHLRAGVALASGDPEGALLELERAAMGYAAAGTALHEAAMRYWAGTLMGGEQGRAWGRSAEADLRKHGVRAPERWFAWALPGAPQAS